MLINLINIGKTIGAKTLYSGLSLTVQPGEKVGLIGRNGIGKTTLLGIMSGADRDYSGTVDTRRGLVIASTAQEHHGLGDQTVLDYVLERLPEYAKLHHIIQTYPETMGDDMQKITEYSDALTRFGELGYYDIEQKARAEFDAFQLPPDRVDGPMNRLSGGQKRFVELVKVTLSDADLALIDEPTNHMDYVAKETFIKWLEAADQSVVVITHDRDVLAVVDRIVEMKGQGINNFPGNYEAFLKQNGAATAKDIDTYENGQKRIVKLEKQIREAKSKKASWSGTADKTNPFMLLERRLTKERDELMTALKKPDFWIDQDTVSEMQDKVAEKYEKYKARNIRLRTGGEHRERRLIRVEDLSLGYGEPLFEGISFDLAVGERLRLHGRNGAGKSTLVRAILAAAWSEKQRSTTFAGTITVDPKAVIGTYEQEIDERYLQMPLASAITRVYRDRGVEINDQRVKQILAEYLFDPMLDGRLEISRLSGGQKARFQLIAMLCHNPNLLILDEPTNHLDLPSIEELEKALDRYQGAVLYISHDSYFTNNTGGEVIEIV
ncbi:MAG TPA: ABC-F family ATP-binding cassette domain-containing protein [Candidatus Saccharimonadia bacterium]|nr:ABC-F family ATP-binding cassette domain-containing protein [Candidatus Saccharimonadia bacterium]